MDIRTNARISAKEEIIEVCLTINIIKMNKQEKLAELHSIRTTLDKVAKSYCATSEERKTVKEISMRLFTEQILPLAEELTAGLVKDTEKLVANNAPSGVQLIDIGLPSGTLWTDRNLGADAPEKTGDYYRFGEIVPFTEDSPKYVYDKIDGNIAGTDRDAATVNLGKNYRMPTFDQIKELLDKCKWKWTKQNGVNGMKVTGPNGNSIFFPASGYCLSSGGSLDYVGIYGFCWSASPNSRNFGHYLYFSSNIWDWGGGNRAGGFPVRPVAEELLGCRKN